ncbi:MAG: Ig-like domain-containing protein [Bacteroidales bacterium]|jgi:hypothetical protein|nr:Ig-like domain-containing protein [Bacteroidales bacterium]
MKTVKLNVQMCCKLVLFMALLGGCSGYPDYAVTNPPFVDITSLDMYIGDTVQITVSPEDATFRWSSDNDEVIKVSQTGEVVALSEGLATITVASNNDELKIDARVRTFIPLTSIALTVDILTIDILGDGQIWAYPVPENASEATFTYISTNTEVATVDATGAVKPVSLGTAEIIISSGSIENRLTVNVTEIYAVVPVDFNTPSNMTVVKNDAGYWEMTPTRNDPYCYTTSVGADVRSKGSVFFIVEYQSSHESNQGQIFYCKPNAAGGVSSDMDLHFDQTGIDPTNESLWREFKFSLSHAINTHGWGETNHRLRFDYVQDNAQNRMLVRNARYEYR